MRHALLLTLCLIAAPAFAGAAVGQDEVPYMDDRSTPEAVVSSYYSAIGRHEYARAWSYYGAASAPAYDKWSEGYADTGRVTVGFGELAQEGAAGSIYYTLPVTLEVEGTGGAQSRFAGCYQLRLVQPTNQTPPFEGIHIESAKLHEVKGDAGFAPASCE